jgi:type VI secretion system protein ImpB
MASESSQHKLDRVKKPRVHLTYDVHTGDAIQAKELPFVVGVLADLSGKPATSLPVVKERKFVDIDRDNFDKVLAGVRPRAVFQVENTLQKDGSKLNVELRFSSIEDFGPEQIADQITPLKKLIEARAKLTNLLNKMDGNDKLEALLQEIVSNTESLKTLSSETGRGETHSGGGYR